MNIKRLLLWTSAVSIAVTVWAFVYWTTLLSGGYEQDYGLRSAKIETLWTIIPVSLTASVLAGVAASVLQPRSRTSSRAGLGLALAAALLAGGILLVLLNLGIK